MTTLPSAGVFGLIATPTVPPADPAGDVRHVAPSLLELEGAHTSPGTNSGVDMRRGALRSAGFLITASIFSCLFIGMALAGAVIASVIHSQLSPRSALAR
jgi:hypothetical protein